MSKAVLISIRPKWCEKIINGEKVVEVRKTRPKLKTPFKCYIYCTSGGPDLNIPISSERLMQDYLDTGSMKSLNCPLGNGKVIGEFVCDMAFPFAVSDAGCIPSWNVWSLDRACLAYEKLAAYIGKGKTGYGLNISGLKIYDAPRELGEFYRPYKCGSCPAKWDAKCSGECYRENKITRPPQSWCYVQEVE